MTKVAFIALGGALGSVLRYLVAGWGQGLTEGTFPLGTLLVNVSGCLLVGIASGAFAGPLLLREEHRLFVLVGFLGGFTTFSTFGFETFAMLSDGQWGNAAFNVVLSNGLCLAALFVGVRLAERWHAI